MNEIRCFTCNSQIPETSDLFGDHVPEEGDISLCLYCGAVAIFAGSGLREASDAELTEILADPGVQLARATRKLIDIPNPAERQ